MHLEYEIPGQYFFAKIRNLSKLDYEPKALKDVINAFRAS